MAGVREVTFDETTKQVASIVNSENTRELLAAYGLRAHKVTWEDTGRAKNSCYGPNISDLTLVVKGDRNTNMPVIRSPNYADVTQDVPIDRFQLTHNGVKKSLRALLQELNVYSDRDSEILTSSQCCILPAANGVRTQFGVQLFNYQCSVDDPAVLVIMVSNQGTTIKILDRIGTILYHEHNDLDHWFAIERLEEVRKRQDAVKTRVDSFKEMTDEEKLDNTLLIIQVPLKQENRPVPSFGNPSFGSPAFSKIRSATVFGDPASFNANHTMNSYAFKKPTNSTSITFGGAAYESATPSEPAKVEPIENYEEEGAAPLAQQHARGIEMGMGMDMGQLTLGDSVGRSRQLNIHTLRRDNAFPIRCTYQYYRVTDLNYIDEKMVKDIKEQLDQTLKYATASGSLVLNKKSDRVTEPQDKTLLFWYNKDPRPAIPICRQCVCGNPDSHLRESHCIPDTPDIPYKPDVHYLPDQDKPDVPYIHYFKPTKPYIPDQDKPDMPFTYNTTPFQPFKTSYDWCGTGK